MKEITYISKYKNMSISLNTTLPFVIQESNGFRGVEADVKTFRSVGQQGCTIQSSTVRERDITIRGAIVYDTNQERDTLRKKVYDTFHPRHSGTIKITTRSDIKYEIEDVYIVDAPTFTEDLNKPNIDYFSVNIICPNPFILSTEKKISLQNKTGNFRFSWEILKEGISLADIDARAIQNAVNNGAVETPVKIVIRSRGHMENPFIYNITTGEAIRINKTVEPGESIEITTHYGNKRVTFIDNEGNRENIFPLIDLRSTFFNLTTGDNLIKYGADTTAENMTVDIYYRERHLGV